MYLRGSLVHCFERACPTAANCSDTKDSFYVQQITYLLTFINNVWKCYEILLHNKGKKVQQNTEDWSGVQASHALNQEVS